MSFLHSCILFNVWLKPAGFHGAISAFGRFWLTRVKKNLNESHGTLLWELLTSMELGCPQLWAPHLQPKQDLNKCAFLPCEQGGALALVLQGLCRACTGLVANHTRSQRQWEVTRSQATSWEVVTREDRIDPEMQTLICWNYPSLGPSQCPVIPD